jgi:hypothetical protein
MTDGNRRFNSSGISAAAVLLSVAVAIIASLALNNWWLLVPVILLELGVFVLILGFSVGRPSQGMIGVLLIINTFFPGYVIILFVVLLVWFAIFALLFSMRKKA